MAAPGLANAMPRSFRSCRYLLSWSAVDVIDEGAAAGAEVVAEAVGAGGGEAFGSERCPLSAQNPKTIAPANPRPTTSNAAALPQAVPHDWYMATRSRRTSVYSSEMSGTSRIWVASPGPSSPAHATSTASVGVGLGTATVLPASTAAVSSEAAPGSAIGAMVAISSRC